MSSVLAESSSERIPGSAQTATPEWLSGPVMGRLGGPFAQRAFKERLGHLDVVGNLLEISSGGASRRTQHPGIVCWGSSRPTSLGWRRIAAPEFSLIKVARP